MYLDSSRRPFSPKSNHTLRNLVSTFLEARPDRRRPKDELEELDKSNKVRGAGGR